MLGGINPYGYVHNPTGWVDPLGLAACQPNRRQALNKAKDLAGIPRSQQPLRQWTVGNNPMRRGQTNYKYSEDLGSHGRYYEYSNAQGHKRVIVEHLVFILMRDNPNLEQIHELMILKRIATRKLLTHLLTITIYIMNNKLEEKLLYKKAEKYANQLKGLESFTLSYVEGKDFIWHKKQLSNVNKLDSNISGMVFNHPVDESELIEYVFNILKDKNITLLFEGRIAIHLSIKNISLFLRDFFERQKSYDLSLFFVDPDKILVISDDEYSLSVYCCN